MTAQDTRSALVAAAATLLDQGGPEAVTLREVGRRVGVSHNAPYKHFQDKEELLAAVAAAELKRQERIVVPAIGGSGLKTLRTMMRGYVAWARRYPQRFRLTFGAWKSESTALGDAASAARAGLVDVVRRAQSEADLPKGDPERLAYLFLCLAHGAADLALAGHLSANDKGHADPEDLIDDLIAYVARPRKPRT